MSPIGEVLRQVRGAESREEVAKRLEIHPNTLARYESGERSPDAEFLLKFAAVFGVSVGMLFSGDALRVRTVNQAPAFFPPDDDSVSVPLYEVRASAGNGGVVWSEHPATRVIYPRSWLKAHGINPAGAKLMRADG